MSEKISYKMRLVGVLIMMFVIFIPMFILWQLVEDNTIKLMVYVIFEVVILYSSIQMIVNDDADLFDCILLSLVPLMFIYLLDVNMWFKVWTTTGLIGGFIGIGKNLY